MTNTQRLVLSDLELALLLYHEGIVRDATPEAVADARANLQDKMLLEHAEDDEIDDDLRLTDRGRIHLTHLLQVELPRQTWTHD